MTVRLYQRDSFARTFAATVVAHGRLGERASVILDQTGFYPEAGGQMADRGTLTAGGEARAIVDVQVGDDDLVHHVLDGALPAVGAAVEGAIDWPRRRVHMALHTGQHLLSRALIEAAAAPTVSARLGESACTIDVTREAVPERELAAAEALANAVIDDDVPVRAWFPEPDELARLPLRREPKVSREVRVVAIGDFDVSPCGGTHCARSAQIGSIRIAGSERYKGMTRVTFAAGGRARALLGEHSDAVTRLARELTCAPADVPATLDKLRRQL
ncbi:MAG TPA: alanyl-tRNA editing protein, partial [Kofleriaceae bacterium]|nr:alanyl-tRNA editing protein [Kofleriaceae bacterium]